MPIDPEQQTRRAFGSDYRGDHLARIAFPMGGLGAGMICLEGTGALSHVSLRHKPAVFNEPMMFSALWIRGTESPLVLEGPVPHWKAYGNAGNGNGRHAGCAAGLPRFEQCEFSARFPFATVRMQDASLPVSVELTGWSPFVPGDADASSLPVLALEYVIRNPRPQPVRGAYSFHAANCMAVERDSGAEIRAMDQGFILAQPPLPAQPTAEGYLAAFVNDPATATDCAWFRGGWYDPLTMLWRRIERGIVEAQAPHPGQPGGGGSLYLPFELPPGGSKTIRLQLAWYVPFSDVQYNVAAPACCGDRARPDAPHDTYRASYTQRFDGIEATAAFWRKEIESLRRATRTFSDCFYDTTLPAEVVEAVAANLTILKSPTCLRQHDGRFWGFEGCCDGTGCCAGSCTHVWNYAQAMPHLFPDLERSLRETEFKVSQDARGHQNFRTALPIGPAPHVNHAAADGQLGGIVKLFREWRICGDTDWMRSLWPQAKASLNYCIETWDPERSGTLVEPHHNTYDIEFWGPDGMCTSFYLAALAAAVAMGNAVNDEVAEYARLLAKGRACLETELWNGEYFRQQIRWQGLRADPTGFKALAGADTGYSPEAMALLEREGPKYQYGNGCLSDGVLGDWMACCAGVDTTIDRGKIRRHLVSVFEHNHRASLSRHANPQRPTFAFGDEGGLLLCTWPHGDQPSLPFVYSNEVWTGIEYQVASHLVMLGRVEEGLQIVRSLRQRYDGRYRNPFDEYECGHWYARAMASYALLQAFSGARYDAVDRTLHLKPAVQGDFRAFLCTSSGYGTVGMRNGQPFVEVVSGSIPIQKIIGPQATGVPAPAES